MLKSRQLFALSLACTLMACQTAQLDSPNIPKKQETQPLSETIKQNPAIIQPSASPVIAASANPIVKNTLSKYSQALQAYQKESLKSSVTIAPGLNTASLTAPSPNTAPSPMPSGTSAPTELGNNNSSNSSSGIFPEPTPEDLKKLIQLSYQLMLKQVAELEATQPPEALAKQHTRLLQGLKQNKSRSERLLKEIAGKTLTVSEFRSLSEKIITDEGLSLSENAKQSQELSELQFEIMRMALAEETQSKYPGNALEENAYAPALIPIWKKYIYALTDSFVLENPLNGSLYFRENEKLKQIQPKINEFIQALERLNPPTKYTELHYTLLAHGKQSQTLIESLLKNPLPIQNPQELIKALFGDFELLYNFGIVSQSSYLLQKEVLLDQTKELEKQAKEHDMQKLTEAPRFKGDFKALRTSNEGIQLTWTTPPEGTATLILYRNEPEKIFKSLVQIATLEPGTSNYSDQASLASGKAYQYTLSFQNAKGEILAALESTQVVF